MKIVVDANILFSALIKDSKTRAVLFSDMAEFYTPEFVFEELNEHRKEIIEKSKVSEEISKATFASVLQKINVIPDEDLIEFTEKAERLAKKIDVDDVQYIAAVLKTNAAFFWSDDRRLKKIKEIKISNSLEVASLFSQFSESFSSGSVDFFP